MLSPREPWILGFVLAEFESICVVSSQTPAVPVRTTCVSYEIFSLLACFVIWQVSVETSEAASAGILGLWVLCATVEVWDLSGVMGVAVFTGMR